MLTRACTYTLKGHGKVAVTVIGSCCRGQSHNSQLSVIIHHGRSCGLDASACVCVCACAYVHVCVCVRVIVGEIGKLLVIYFSMLKEDRRNVGKEEEEEEGGRNAE